MPSSESPELSPGLSPPVEQCWFLTGATASGKTAVGLELAEKLGAEIVSLDSMAIYRGMDLGTAKPSSDDRARVPHHLLDLVEPDQEFSLAQYVEAAHAVVQAIKDRGAKVLFVGGTPLYLKALLRGVSQGPPPDWEFRRSIEEELERVGVEALHQRLAAVDPLSAQRLHPHDKRRIIRALEVYKTTGRPISHVQTQFDEPAGPLGNRVLVLSWTRAILHERIEARVDWMFQRGLVQETRGILARFPALSRTAAQAVGYSEVIEHLRGRFPLPETIQRVKQHTRQFAKRQETWFRSLSECIPLAQDSAQSPAETARRIVEQAG